MLTRARSTRLTGTAVLFVSVSMVAAVAAQTKPASGAPVSQHAAAKKPYAPPRTAWGDPDISGPVTNVFEASTPFERPSEFAGRRLDDISSEELLRFRNGLAERTLKNFEGPLHGPDNWWQTIYDLRKGGQAWFVIDPE